MRSRIIVLVVLVTAGCGSDATGPGESRAGIDFGIDGVGAHTAVGNPQPDASGTILNSEFAVARPDSVGGFAIISFEPTGTGVGNLFVLQAPRQTGTYECTLFAGPCHGRLIIGVRDGNTISVDRYFHVISGSLTVTEIGPARLKGTFRLTLEANDDEPDDRIEIENGTIHVPFIESQVTDGALQCLLSLVGIGQGTCRA
jgi:hypothetical protein